MRLAPLLALLVPLAGYAASSGEANPCAGCHAGAAQHSYALSKHGVIARLDAGRERRRAPGCADCHVSEARWPALPHHADPKQRQEAQDAATSGCGACHSPRYVTAQLDAAKRTLAIGEMKVREAQSLVEAARRELGGAPLARIESLFAAMRDERLRNLRLGLAHQSPDYQWWHGQAALDGDLLRIKGALGDARRAVSAPSPGDGAR